jgi:hypothetical protein
MKRHGLALPYTLQGCPKSSASDYLALKSLFAIVSFASFSTARLSLLNWWFVANGRIGWRWLV